MTPRSRSRCCRRRRRTYFSGVRDPEGTAVLATLVAEWRHILHQQRPFTDHDPAHEPLSPRQLRGRPRGTARVPGVHHDAGSRSRATQDIETTHRRHARRWVAE